MPIPASSSAARTLSRSRAATDRVEREGALVAVGDRRHVATIPASAGVVARGDLAAAAELRLEDVELDEEDRRLERVEPAGQAEDHRLVAGALAAVRADHAHGFGEPRVSVRIAPPSP